MAKREGPHPLACFLPLQMRLLQPPELGATAGVGERRLPGSPSPTSFSP